MSQPELPKWKYAHWQGSQHFHVPVVGESFYRDDIQSIVRNPVGRRAYCLVTAYLVPYSTNKHDKNAVKVVVCGKVVGHLDREYAVTYREYASEMPDSVEHMSVDALITGGIGQHDGEKYDYSICLDIPEDLRINLIEKPHDDILVCGHGYGALKLGDYGTYTATVLMPLVHRDELHKNLDVTDWTTDHWDTINWYVMNRQGIGIGFKIYAMSKTEYSEKFGTRTVDASLELGEGRFAKLILKPC